jgi:nucleoid-associated protein YgaU
MQYYGTPNRWRKIADANKDVLKDPNKIRPGTRLTIPD